MPTNFFHIIKLLRLNQPVGIFLLFYPCAFGVLLSWNTTSDLYYLALFFIGSVIMRSAGCIINDIIDRDIDIYVKRTKNRPLAAKKIRLRTAIFILIILLIMGFRILLELSQLPQEIALYSMLLVIIYPFCKRIIFCPQIILGLVFNIGVLISYAQIKGQIDDIAIAAYIGCIFWTLGYDTIYGFADIEDDLTIGTKSLAIYLNDKWPKFWIGCFYTSFVLLMMTATGIADRNNIFSLIGYILVLFLLYHQVYYLNIKNPDLCIKSFKYQMIVGAIILIGVL
jgi:4-hydroxybenzoate polyprenyltransferase